MGADVSESLMRTGLPIITMNGIVAMATILLMIFYTLYNFRSLGHTVEKDIRRSSMSVFYSSFALAFVQVLLWSGIFTDKNDCIWIVKINVITLHIAKMCLYYLYTVRLDFTFRDTDWKMPPILLFFIRHDGKTTLDTNWGLYCNIQLSSGVIFVYGAVDLTITVYLMYLFVTRLLKSFVSPVLILCTRVYGVCCGVSCLFCLASCGSSSCFLLHDCFAFFRDFIR